MRLSRSLGLAGLLIAGCVVLGPAALPASAQPVQPMHARWLWPVPGSRPVVLRGFAPPEQPWLPGHRGVDLRAHAGAIVRSAGSGRVHFAGRIGHIWVVSVQHPDGLLTTYEPVRPLVQRGAWVEQGEPIGRLLSRGGHCSSPCLHWGLRRGTAYLDPLSLVGAARVRLLPLYRPDGPLPAPLSASVATGGLSLGAAVATRRRRERRWRRRPAHLPVE